jgi:beta-mannanase
MDTNNDGVISSLDDPFGPFYPGDDYVDWVGCSAFDWGWSSTSNGNNVLSSSNTFYTTMAPLQTWVTAYHPTKPIMIPEIAKFYAPLWSSQYPQATMVSSYLNQVYNKTLLTNKLPSVKAIIWFNEDKYESWVSDIVDWRFTSSDARYTYQTLTQNDAFFVKAPV